MFSKIIHATDLTDASTAALKAAHDLAKAVNAELLVCYIAHPPLIASGDTLTDPNTNETHNVADEINAQVAIDPAVNMDLKIVLTDQATSVKSLLELLENMDCDLLVIGMHKRSGIKSWLSSSITEEVVRRASCAVMVVKQGDEVTDEE